MPELPEVETIRRGLERALQGRSVLATETGQAKLRKPSQQPLSTLEGQKFQGARRHAKVLFLDWTGGTLVSHLGMTGKWLFAESGAPVQPHTHLRMWLDNEQELRYTDPRRFGWLSFHDTTSPPKDTDHYGIDALSPDFDVPLLEALLRSSRAPLKAFLLDQTKVAGIGNIYAVEALWRAGLSPRRKACNTPIGKVPRLRQSIVDVLEDSLRQGGTSFNDYVNTIGEPGKFIADLAVFHREGHPCPRCGTDVRRITQAGRSTFYCSTCQR